MFTDDQIKNMSKDALLLPFVINDPATGYVGQKALLTGSIEKLEVTDTGTKVFSDLFESVQAKYHAELALLNNSQRTNYNDADLVAGGKGAGPHYPDFNWISFSPKLIDSVNGLPVSTLSNKLEKSHSTNVSMLSDILKNGFNDGSFTKSVTISGTSFSSTDGLGTLAQGNRMVIDNGAGVFLAKVVSITSTTVTNADGTTSTTTTCNFEVVYGTAFTGSANVRTYASGFTDGQRNGTEGISDINWYNFLTNGLDTVVGEWKTYITDMKAVIDGNNDFPPRKAHNQTASTNCGNALKIISDWQARPTSTVEGRFTNTHLAPIETLVTTRNSYTPARIDEIIADLGSVTQDAEGNFTGTGAYGDLFKNIDMRIARGAGSLSAVNNAMLGVTLIDKKIATANDQLTQYNNIFAITKISSDTIVGQIDFPVESATGFSVNDAVKVMDNNGSVYTRTIIQITGNVIRVNSGIPVVLTLGGMARIVKLK